MPLATPEPCRPFRRRFGMSPSAYRDRAPAAARTFPGFSSTADYTYVASLISALDLGKPALMGHTMVRWRMTHGSSNVEAARPDLELDGKELIETAGG
jgi:hypothetical protein